MVGLKRTRVKHPCFPDADRTARLAGAGGVLGRM